MLRLRLLKRASKVETVEIGRWMKTSRSSATSKRSKRLPSAVASARLVVCVKRSAKVAGANLKAKLAVRLEDGTIYRVELHWYEVHGLGRKKLKIKEYLD